KNMRYVLSQASQIFTLLVCVTVFNCKDKPVFTPSRLVVKYGDPASVICTCQQECLNEIFNIEHSVGKVTINRTTISWNIDNFTDWTARLQCYYNKAAENVSDPDVQCCTVLPLTVYKPPDKVSISFANHTGPLIEAHPYTLQCTVHNVAPVEKVKAIFYRGHSVVGQVQVNNSYGGKPMTHSYTLDVIPHKGEDGAAYWCAAELVLGPEGPQPPPVVISQNMTTTVYSNNIVYIILGILFAVVLLVIIGVIIWTRDYKNERTGQYDFAR
uniref:Vascular cell adhesion protein 1-like n=1 Tax=Labrus bergylta TaxID=56723 RepID=A0A3Q3N6Z3_9LABR